MRKIQMLFVMAVLTAGGLIFYACNKVAPNQVNDDWSALAHRMAKDKDVQVFQAVIHLLQDEINVDFGRGNSIPPAAAAPLLKGSVRNEQITWLAKKGNEIGNRYRLDQYGNIARHELFWEVFALIEQDASLSGNKLQHRPARKLALADPEQADPYARLAGYNTVGCIDWYFVTVNTITSEVVDETYLYTTCDEQNGNQVPQPDWSGGGPEVVIPAPVTCEEEWQVKKERCERNAKVDAAVAFVSAGVLILLSDGALSPSVAVGYGSAITKMAVTYNNCIRDAQVDYNSCVEKRKTGV